MKSTSMRQEQEEETPWRLGVEQNQDIKTTFSYFVTFTRNKMNIHFHMDTQKESERVLQFSSLEFYLTTFQLFHGLDRIPLFQMFMTYTAFQYKTAVS